MGRAGTLWPEGRRFAFTIFDDPDGQLTATASEVYSFLRDCGFRTTRGCWSAPAVRESSDIGENCSYPPHAEWLKRLQAEGFELGLHNVTNHTSYREETRRGLDTFRELFGHHPVTMSNHFSNDEGIYFGGARLTGTARWMYHLVTRGRNLRRFTGHVEGDPLFWGDLCRDRIRYVRNFVFRNVNTLAVCPVMPYHDPLRPFVPAWFASAEGADRQLFLNTLTDRAIDSLEEEGGCCILYTHFAKGFHDGAIHPQFRACMERLAKRNGWFVPVGPLLDYLALKRGGIHPLRSSERRRLEWRWLFEKIRYGSQ